MQNPENYQDFVNSSSPSGQALPPGTHIEEFVIERILGVGGFGMTYLALDNRLDRKVVIKENLPVQFCYRDSLSMTVAPRHTHGDDVDNFLWSLENFSRESAMLASLDHPGIVKVLRSFEAFGTAYFVMPYVEGVALDELAKQRAGTPFTQKELRDLLDDVLSALGYLHERGIYHRDIKPGNILITSEGKPVLIDFGSARQRLSERSMTVVESAGYTPFEQLQSRGNVGPWSDLYALAATIVKIMTGEAPPKANDRTMGDPWQPLCEREEWRGRYSARFLECLDRALRLPIEERWQNAEQWKMGLSQGEIAPLAKNDVSAITASTTTKKSHGGLISAITATVMFACGLAWWNVREPAPGALVIMSDPAGAEVLDDSGKNLGKSPLELKGLPGGKSWNGQLELEGYSNAPIRADVQSGDTTMVPLVKLQATPQRVVVMSEPSGAKVMQGGVQVGETPWESPAIAPGSRVEYVLRKEGYEERSLGGAVVLGKSLVLQGKLQPTPQKVVVTSEPSGAKVMQEGKQVGVTPWESPAIAPGSKVEYVLSKDGYDEQALSGEVKTGESLLLRTKLEIIPMQVTKAGEEREFEISRGVKMTFCWCPAGDFLMGSPSTEVGRLSWEDQVKVTLSKGFWMAKTEVTQKQWESLMGSNPSEFEGDDLPVDSVIWDDAQKFLVKLNERLGNEDGGSMGLPTEAQWEYACRAGETDAYSGGTIDEVAWYDDNSGYKTHAVGTKKANAWGLHDMHGNVLEWCQDWYDSELSGGIDPKGPASGTSRVYRGGSWISLAFRCRAANRNGYAPSSSFSNRGFRVARSSVP
jgi:formylglycine-generating enzyme required for sulfatase activity